MTSQYDEVAQEIQRLIDSDHPGQLKESENDKLAAWRIASMQSTVEKFHLAQ